VKLIIDVPEAAAVKVAHDPDTYLGPLLIAIGAELLRQIKEANDAN
jgi:hypothetical protein